MRVIGGEFRSRRLKSIPGAGTRPTPDRLRQTLFNILAPRIEGSQFIDAYAGTGSVGIEALSRGAAHAWFLERNRTALEAIRANLEELGLTARATVLAGAAAATIARCPAGIVFLDPPYTLESEYAAMLDALAPLPASLVIAQHSIRLVLPAARGAFVRTRLLRQGDNALSFFEPAAAPPAIPAE